MFRSKNIIILFFVAILFFMGSVAATENSSTTNITDVQMECASNNSTYSYDFNFTSNNSTNYTDIYPPEGSNLTLQQWEELCGCCSVVVHVSEGYDVLAYRRDSSYAATLYLQHLDWYGKEALKEFKDVQGYFFHTIVTGDGWMVSMGGLDVPSIVRELENLAGGTSVSGSITDSTINNALNALQRLGMGHFLIKDPMSVVGYAIYNGGSRTGLFQLGNGQYVSVPNGPGAYRQGYTSLSDPVYSAFSLENSDTWGVNRRNIIVYEFFRDHIPGSSLVKVFAARTIMSDTIVFNGNVISGGSLPVSPDRIYLGEVLLKYYEPNYFGYQSMIYMYSDILNSYVTTGILPSSGVTIPWKILTDPNAGPFKNNDVLTAATWVNNYININHQLPSTVTINGHIVNIYTYFYLATVVVQNLYSENTQNIYLSNYKEPQVTKDTIVVGSMGVVEYIGIADQVKVYMDRTGVTPGYACGTSLGAYFGYQSMIYMYSVILDSYNVNGVLPDRVLVKPWKIISNPNAGPYTNEQVATAAQTVKEYMDINHKLPDTITINGYTISIYSYLHIAATVVQNIYSSNPQNVYAVIDAPPQLTKDTINAGSMGVVEYIGIADQVKVYMDRTGVTPGYACGTSLGAYFGYQSMIYMYSVILDSYNVNGVLPDRVLVKPWKIISNPNAGPYTNTQVANAGKWVKNFVDTNHQLPGTVSIGEHSVSIYMYFYLTITVVQNLYSNNPADVYAANYTAPQTTKDTLGMGNMSMADFIGIADQVKVYMDRTGVTPGFAIL